MYLVQYESLARSRREQRERSWRRAGSRSAHQVVRSARRAGRSAR